MKDAVEKGEIKKRPNHRHTTNQLFFNFLSVCRVYQSKDNLWDRLDRF